MHDASTHAKGKLHNFVVKTLGEVPYNLDALYRAVVEDCRTRSKYTGKISTFEDLIRYKAISRSDVDDWLAAAAAHVKVPDWAEISADLTYDALRKMRLRSEWLKYRAKVLDSGDEGNRSVRRDIRTALASFEEAGLSLSVLLDEMVKLVRPSAIKHLTPYSDDRLLVMILYEVI